MAGKRYQVFISSTYKDLQKERFEVLNSLLSMNCVPVGMELFPSSNREQFEYVKRLIDSSDYYIVILAGHYGSPADDSLVYTEKEFDYALARGVPVYAFIHKNPEKRAAAQLEKFREKAKTGKALKEWTTRAGLVQDVAAALRAAFADTPRTGWIEADTPPQDPDVVQKLQQAKLTIASIQTALAGERAGAAALEKELAEAAADRRGADENLAQARRRAGELEALLTWKEGELGATKAQLERQLATAQAYAAQVVGLERELAAARAANTQTPAPRKGDILRQGSPHHIGPETWAWRVLDVQDGRALLVTEEIVEKRAYNGGGEPAAWAESTLREYLNETFIQERFSEEDRRRIAGWEHDNPENPWYGTPGGNPTQDKIFLLSTAETVKYFGDSGDLAAHKGWYWKDGKIELRDGKGYFIYDEYNRERMAEIDKQPFWWWLRSPGYNSSHAAFADTGGNVDLIGYYVDYEGGVRPALWLQL